MSDAPIIPLASCGSHMQLERLIAYFSTSPAIRLLRSPNAAHIVYFLDQRFKESGQITWPHSELAARLANFQEEIRASGLEALRDRAETYLSEWCGGDTRWLSRHLEAGVNEPVYELSPHTELVLKFLRDILDQRLGFVGTESRLRRIIEALSNLVIRGSDDPQRRLEYLRAERERIDAEIAGIERDGVVATYTPTAIRERFADAVSDLIQLQSDFRAVEDSFKQITRDVQRKQSESRGSRGEILGYALDAEDSLKTEDQGISFHEFVRLVLSPAKQEELERIIGRLEEITELADQRDGLRRVHGMVPSLLAEAQKVLRTTQRLSMTLRRLLDTRAAAGRMRLAELIRDVRQLASQLSDDPPSDRVGIEVETDVDLTSVTEKTFWSPSPRFDAAEMRDVAPDEDDRLAAFKALALMQRLDWSEMRRTITTSLGTRESLTLAELLEMHPPENGVVEILGYVQIAHDDGHEVDPRTHHSLAVPLGHSTQATQDYRALAGIHGSKARRDVGDADSHGRSVILFDVPRVIFRSVPRTAAPTRTAPARTSPARTSPEESPQS